MPGLEDTMHTGARAVVGLTSGLALAVSGMPPAMAAPVTADQWQSWLVAQQSSFVERTRTMALAVDQRIAGTGDLSAASVKVSGTVNPDGSMRVDLVTPGTSMAVLCSGPTHCWAHQGSGGTDRLWHRIPAHEVASLRHPLPIDGIYLSPVASHDVEGSLGAVGIVMDEVETHARASFANGAYAESHSLTDNAEGVSLTMSKSLTPTSTIQVHPPKAATIGAPMSADVIPQLP
jgi:hypothetical protein